MNSTVEIGSSRDGTTPTRVVRLRRKGGVIVVDCDVYIGRRLTMGGWNLPSSPWANPFQIGRDGTREEVLKRYRQYLLERPELMARLPELAGKTLGCWCKPQACHGDVLVELLGSIEPPAVSRD